MQVSHTCANGKVITMTFVDPGVPRKANHFFNTAAKKAVAAVIAGDAAAGCERPYTYDEVARWMLTSEKLSKNRIGDYLGRTDEHAMATIDAFLGHLDFTPFVFDEALRFFLSLFKLPGEAQQIDRIMEKFAAQYTKAHPQTFTAPETAYVLAFSLIMLNTDAHSDQARARPPPPPPRAPTPDALLPRPFRSSTR